tara:strand:+ start:818 stop:1519 length:702 start_codon:yes stop_codon:yes gene_type:complete
MTVNTKKITSGPYAGNSIADTFSYTFKINDKTQLSVYETDVVGVETLLTLDTDYTVNNIGNSGTVTRNIGALPTDYQWFIRSNYEETQLTAFGSQGPFFPDIHENAMDKLTMLIQQILDQGHRSPAVSDSYTGILPLTLGNPVSGWGVRWSADLSTLEVFDIDARYANIDGDTMSSPLAGPDSQKSDDYMPQLQITNTIDERMNSAPEFDPNNFQDYGLVTQAVNDSNDYGSI